MQRLLLVFLLFDFSYSHSQALVIPGDFPDPSVMRFGENFWATATTSNWAPAFPLMSSKDLIHWELQGYTFDKLPGWADYYFWAPEISNEKGKVYLYYTAHKRGGGLCVGIASASKPQGPFKDHGPVMCQEAGSIDAFPIRDEHGKLFLIWKEDGNSIKQPTPIWAIEMNEDRTAVIGEKTELFRNDAPWEQNLVEGVSILRHGNFFYAFYSGAGCCGRGCSYALGIARAKNLMGPWEKYSKNPLLTTQGEWKCPGHGTPVEKNGRHYLLYHAYHVKGSVYTGRQALLQEFKFTEDGWLEFQADPSQSDDRIPTTVQDDFAAGDTLSPLWQWPVFDTLQASVENGVLTLQGAEGKTGAFIGQKITTTDFEAETTIIPVHSDAESGLALFGDENNLICASYVNGLVRVWKIEAGREILVKEKRIKPDNLFLRMKVRFRPDGSVLFSYSTDRKFIPLGSSVDSFFLPPWDRAVRAGLLAKGARTERATFDNFILRNK